jgi:phage baseplate assembly protein W
MEYLGSDIQINFEENDIMFNNNNDFKVVSNEDNLKQAIINRLVTKKGDLITHKYYGSDLHLLIGRYSDDATLNTAGAYIYQALEDEYRIASVDSLTVDIRKIDDQQTLVIFLTVTSTDSDDSINLVVNYDL